MGILTAILILLAGCGVFIAGMNMLGDGLEKSAGGGMKRLLGKISGNRFSGVGIGAAVTAIIQSSSATSVMVIGFVNAGIMTLFQATSIIMGASIGTTITGVIVAFSSLKIVKQVVASFAFVGVVLTFFKKDKIKQIGGILCGFGLIFVGLDVMGSAFDNYPQINEMFSGIFKTVNFPLLLILCGAIFTALIQSSSAATGIFIIMVGQGALGLENALYLVLGANIGTCVTGMLACIGTNVNAKRTALIHVVFKVIGTIFFTTLIWIFQDFIVGFLQGMIPNNPQMQLAWFHVIFNVTTTLLLLPFIKQLIKISEFFIKDKTKGEDEQRRFKFVDERLLKTPPIALMQVKKEMQYMASLAGENLQNAFRAGVEKAENYEKAVMENEEIIDFTNKNLTKFLIKLSSLVDEADEKRIGSYFHVLNDLERIGDHAENFYEIGAEMQRKELAFSAEAQAEVQKMQEKVLRMFEIATEAFDDADSTRLAELTVLENEVDGLKRELSSKHYARLAEGNCKLELSPYYSSTVIGLERVADHLVNVGYSILNPTGSQSEVK